MENRKPRTEMGRLVLRETCEPAWITMTGEGEDTTVTVTRIVIEEPLPRRHRNDKSKSNI